MGPGATKVNFFEAPSVGDGEHHLVTVGPLQLGIACQGQAAGTGAVKFILFLTIPGPFTTLSSVPTSGEPIYETITGGITDAPQETTVEVGKTKTGAAGTLIVAGPDGVPYWLTIDYGANSEATSSAGPPASATPRGCWLLAEEV
jgi:type IV secretory pathway TrbL component